MRKPTLPEENAPLVGADETLEALSGLQLCQKKKGYRFSLDPFLLAAFVRPRPRERVADLGTGCGVIALLLARRFPTINIDAVELQPELARLARGNVLRNRLGNNCSILEGDVRSLEDVLPGGAFQRVVSNPPFRSPQSGRICPEPQRALARQELALTLPELARAADHLLAPKGFFDFIHLPERLPFIFSTLTNCGLEPKTLRLVSSTAHSPPELALVSARKGSRPGLNVMAPFILYGEDGKYSSEVDNAFL